MKENMNYKSDLEIEKEFDDEYIKNNWWRTGDDHPFNLDADPSRIKSFIFSIRREDREWLQKQIKNWKYRYDNYQTMMNNQKSFQKGSLARDLADELLSLLNETN